MDDQRTEQEAVSVDNRPRRRAVFSLRKLFVAVALFAALFYVIHRHLEVRDYDVDAQYMSLQGRRIFLENLKESYDKGRVDKKHVAYIGLEKSIAENNQQIKELKWITKPNPEN
jgi:hypothetical protein